MDSLLTKAEELDFRRDLMEYIPESFSGGQIIDLLHEQRRICDAMEREVREDFASHGHELQERLLESLDGAGDHDRLWRKSTSPGATGINATGPQPGSRSRKGSSALNLRPSTGPRAS